MSLPTADFEQQYVEIENLMSFSKGRVDSSITGRAASGPDPACTATLKVFGEKKLAADVDRLLLPFEGWPKAWCVYGVSLFQSDTAPF